MKPEAVISVQGASPAAQQAGAISRVRWGIVIILFSMAVVNYLDRATLSIANTTIADEFGFSATEMGLLMSAFLWPYALANLPAGWLVDKIGPKKLVPYALGIWSTFTFVVGFAHNYAFIYGLRMLLGLAESPFYASTIKITHRWFLPHERGLPTAIINTGAQFANALAPPVLIMLLLAFGWRGMFMAIGLLGLPLLLAWWKFYRDPDAREAALLHVEQQAAAKSCTTTGSWSRLFRYRETWAAVVGSFCIQFTVWVYMTWLPGYMQKSLGLSLKDTGWLASLPYLAGIFGVLLGGIISDRLIHYGAKPISARKVPIYLGAALAACFVAAIPFAHSIPLVILLLSLGYFFSQLPQSALWTLASEVAPSGQVASLGSIQCFGGFTGAALAPFVAGLMLDLTGSFTPVFLLGAGLLCIGALSYGLLVRRRIPDA